MILNELDRTFFEYLRKIIVANNRLPDWRTLTGTEEQKRAAYKTAKEVIGKDSIEIFGYGGARDRGTKYNNTIVIDRKTADTGVIGGYKTTYLDTDGKTRERPKSTVHIDYTIRFFAEDVFTFNLMENIVVGLFLNTPYFKLINPENWELSDIDIFTVYTGLVDLTSVDFLEKVLTFSVRDIYLDSDINPQNFVLLNTINYSIFSHFNTELNDTTSIKGSVSSGLE
jgi:hypothetical protein